jgi:hypothetical protein
MNMGTSMGEIIAPKTNAPFALAAKSARRHGRPQPRRARRPRSPFFRRGFPDGAVARIRPCRDVNDVDIPSFARTIRTRSRRLSSFIGLDRFLPMRVAAAPEGCA